jgi:hypothetical protein
MNKIFDKLYIASTGSGDALSVYTSTASSNLININTATTSYDAIKIRSYADTLTYTRDIITTYAGTGATSFNGEGVFRTNFNINSAANIAFDSQGNMYISHSHRISKVDKITGLVTTIAGTSNSGTASDCTASDARFNSPKTVVFDNNDDFFLADSLNKRIIKYTATASYISTLYTNLSAIAIYSIALDTNTNDLYVSLYNNKVIKLTAPSYITSTDIISGLNDNFGIDFDSSSNTLYVANQSYPDGGIIQKVVGGVTTIVAGTGSDVIDGVSATSSSLFKPLGVTFYNNELYICQRDGNRIRKVDSNGIITTIAGYTSSDGFYGEGISPLYAKLREPYDVKFYNGEMYIADTVNNRVRKVTFNTNPYTRTSNATASYLYYEKESNLFSVRGDGMLKLNGNFQLKDINFATSSYATNSLIRADVSNYILHDGSKINSAWFKNIDFARNGTMFWMEPGYSKTWQAYSSLGDVEKLYTSLSFPTDSLISFPVFSVNNFPGSTFSEIYDILASSNGVSYNLPIFKTYSSNRINLNIDTYGMTLSNLDLTLIGRNISLGTASATYSFSAYSIEFYVLNTLSTTASFTVSTTYFTNQNYTISPYSFTRLETKIVRTFNDYSYFATNHGLYTSYFYSTNGSSMNFNLNTINATGSWAGTPRTLGSGNYLVWVLNSTGIITNRTLVKFYGQNLLSTTYSLTYNSPNIGVTVSYILSPSQSGSPSTLQLINAALVGTTWSSALSIVNNNALSLRYQAYYSTTGADIISINQLLISSGITSSNNLTLSTGGTNSYKMYITSTT